MRCLAGLPWMLVLTAVTLGCGAPPAPVRTARPAAAPAATPPSPAPATAPAPIEDPHLWLEDITGAKAIDWVKQHNAKSLAELEADPRFAPMRERLLRILDSKDRIPPVQKLGRWYYNFWRDDVHPRGLWRRTALAEYRKASPRWEPVLDVDELAKREGENWVYKGSSCLYPKRERCLVMLSRGGADATVIREFDTVRKAFVPDGFSLPEAKSRVAWRDVETIYVGTNFGPGSLTDSGYPRLVKEWRRGTSLTQAKTIFEGEKADVSSGGYRDWDHGHVRDFVVRRISFYESQYFLREGARLVPIAVPKDAEVDTWDDQLLVTLRTDWAVGGRTWPKGALLATPLTAFLAGERRFFMLYEPAATKSLEAVSSLKHALVVNELEDVHNRLFVWRRPGGQWTRTALPTSGIGTFNVVPVEANDSDEYWFWSSGFTTPSTLELGAVGRQHQPLKRSPAFFDATGLVVEQHFVRSKDGTRVPYFQVSRKDLPLTGERPTLLEGYGGFEISNVPHYDALTGAAWLERGGVLAVANIRGGGEYGPAWHQAALKTNRQRAYDDFIAVAEDLLRRRVTAPRRLGIRGGSNGGLLVGVMLTERPDLFGAVVCEVPLLDMKRYHKLLAGASWMAEYGDPNVPREWAAIRAYSPYQNVRREAKYPRTLFTTSTRDDRVHPGHARKMVARMTAWHHDVLYYENIEGGHGGAANNQQRAFLSSLAFTFLVRQLGLK